MAVGGGSDSVSYSPDAAVQSKHGSHAHGRNTGGRPIQSGAHSSQKSKSKSKSYRVERNQQTSKLNHRGSTVAKEPVCDITSLCAESMHSDVASAAAAASPSKLRVAGFCGLKAAQRRWDDQSVEYSSIPARCNEITPLGMAPDSELYDLTSEELAQKEALPQRRGATVLVRGLPRDLCTAPLIQVVLEQAGLKGRVMNCMVRQSQHGGTGEALLCLPSMDIAVRAIWHFHGCSWSSTTGAVRAFLVEVAPMPEVDASLSEAATSRLLEALLEPAENWSKDVEGKDVQAPIPPTAGSDKITKPLSTIWEESSELVAAEVSTDAGASGTSVTSEVEDNHESDEASALSPHTDSTSGPCVLT